MVLERPFHTRQISNILSDVMGSRLKRPLSTERLPAGPPALPASGNARSAWGGGHLFSAVSPNSERRALAFAFTSAPGFLISASPFSKIAAFSGLTALTLETMES